MPVMGLLTGLGRCLDQPSVIRVVAAAQSAQAGGRTSVFHERVEFLRWIGGSLSLSEQRCPVSAASQTLACCAFHIGIV
jgi:hypothetical protein